MVSPYALASYSARNPERILAACPHATEVRTFNGWLAWVALWLIEQRW